MVSVGIRKWLISNFKTPVFVPKLGPGGPFGRERRMGGASLTIFQWYYAFIEKKK